jgi:hypothetical protein
MVFARWPSISALSGADIYISSLSIKFSCTFLRCLPSVESGRNARTAFFYRLFHVVKFEAQGDVANWLEPQTLTLEIALGFWLDAGSATFFPRNIFSVWPCRLDCRSPGCGWPGVNHRRAGDLACWCRHRQSRTLGKSPDVKRLSK